MTQRPPHMAWVAEEEATADRMGARPLAQTGASQAGILLGSNEDIPAFRWVEKETGRVMTCSAPRTAPRSSDGTPRTRGCS